jgi:hypothetical protein
MNINPKDRRNYHRLSVEQKKQLFTAIHKVIARYEGTHLSYNRMYTEPRSKGYRCKLWCCRISSDGFMYTIADRIYEAIQETPMGSMVHSVDAYRVGAFGTGYSRSHNDPAFYIKFK